MSDKNCVDENFIAKTWESINSLRADQKLFDFTIVVDGSQLKAHKLVLAACSDYFKALFNHDVIECEENKITLQDISPAAMKKLLDYCYTSAINLNVDNVQEVLVAASILQIQGALDLCTDYLKERITITNCLAVLVTAERCGLTDLYDSAMEFCLDKFDFILKEDQLKQIDDALLIKIISHDRLNIATEESLIWAISNWISADEELRKLKIYDLMKHVRLTHLDIEDLIRLSYTNIIRDTLECRDLFELTKDFLLLGTHKPVSPPKELQFNLRTPLRHQQRIYAIGGWTNELRPIANAEKFDPRDSTWTQIAPMNSFRCGVGVATFGDSILAIGGHDGNNYLKSVERYDIARNQWLQDVADMTSERTSVATVSLDGFIYAIGGQKGQNSCSIVERYDKAQNVWMPCTSMNERRLGAGVTVLNNRIYVAGGSDNVATNTVEYFDPKTNRWSYAAPMINSRKHLGCTTCDGKIYAVGGRGDCNELATSERYDPETNEWQPIKDMGKGRSGLGLVELGGLLYAMGGHDGDVRLNLVEVYDPKLNRWSIEKPMIDERLGGGFVVHPRLKYAP